MTLDASVVIVSWNTKDLLLQCLKSVVEHTRDVSVEVFVVDNNSTDGSPQAVREQFPQAHLLCNSHNAGFAAANNQAIRRAVGRYILLLNPDTQLLDDAISRSVRFMDEHPNCGFSTCKVLNPDLTFQVCFGESFPGLWSLVTGGSSLKQALSSCLRGGTGSSSDDASLERQVPWVMGAYMLARRTMLDNIGLMDERLFMYGEEPDWCYRARKAGWEIWYSPQGRIIHFGGQSTDQVDQAKVTDWLMKTYHQFYRKHHGIAYMLVCYWMGRMVHSLKLAYYRFRGALRRKPANSTWYRRKVAFLQSSVEWYKKHTPMSLLRSLPE